MSEAIELVSVADGVWTMTFPLTALGADIHRVVTLLELQPKQLLIHSTAPFGKADVAKIRAAGDPIWMVDALLRHDTFSEEGQAAFPHARYCGPPGFDAGNGMVAESLDSPPDDWLGLIDVLAVDGVPDFREYVMLHRPSKTLIVGDLVVNFPAGQGLWSEMIFKLGAVGGHTQPGVTRPFKHAMNHQADFLKSLETILSWDFERIIVGHGEAILTDAKIQLRQAFESAGIISASIPLT